MSHFSTTKTNVVRGLGILAMAGAAFGLTACGSATQSGPSSSASGSNYAAQATQMINDAVPNGPEAVGIAAAHAMCDNSAQIMASNPAAYDSVFTAVNTAVQNYVESFASGDFDQYEQISMTVTQTMNAHAHYDNSPIVCTFVG